MDESAARAVIGDWEGAGRQGQDRALFVEARDHAARILIDAVSDDVRALAVAPLRLLLVAGEATLDMTMQGTVEEPSVAVELWPVRLPAVGVKLVDQHETPDDPKSPRRRTWTFAPTGAEPVTISHRSFSGPFEDERRRAEFARTLATQAGWPWPPVSAS